MDITSVIAWLTLYVVIAAALVAMYVLIGSRMYDFLELRHKRLNFKFARKRLATVSIVITIRNAENEIIPFLRHLVSVIDQKTTVLVIDAASSDKTAKLVRKFTREYQNRNVHIRALHKEINARKAEASTPQNLIKGEIVMRLNLGDQINALSLKHVRHFFAEHKDVDIIIPRRTIIFEQSLISIIGIYVSHAKQNFNKAHELFRVTSSPVAPQIMRANVYSRFASQERQSKEIARYRDDIIVCTQAPKTVYDFLKAIININNQELSSLVSKIQGMPLQLKSADGYFEWAAVSLKLLFRFITMFIPISIGYFLYIALDLHTPVYLLACSAVAILFISFMLSEDTQLTFSQKALLLVTIPAGLIGFYCLSLVSALGWARQVIVGYKHMDVA